MLAETQDVERHRLTLDRAFLVLQRIGQRRSLKLCDVAEHSVQSGEEPG